MKIIPAIDIIDGKCVRLTKGDYNTKKIYNEDPVEVAKSFQDNGVRFIHIVDLDGAKSKHIVNYRVLENIANKTDLDIDFGGGIKHESDLKIAFESGAKQVTVGSIAATNPELFLTWLNQFGSEKLILGADANERKIATHGWQDSSELDVIDFIKNYQEQGVQSVICTDIQKDGMLQGPSIQLYEEILSETNVELIASGGISSMKDLDQLEEIGCAGAILGKAIYEGYITLEELGKRC